MKGFVFISHESCAFFQVYGPPAEEWFEGFSPDLITLPSFISEKGDVLVATPHEIPKLDATPFSALIFEDGGLLPELKGRRKPEAFNRILRLIQSTLDQAITIPGLWKPYNADSLISVQTNTRASGERSRVCFDRRVIGDIIGVCYGIIREDIDFVKRKPDLIDTSVLESRLRAIKLAASITEFGRPVSDSFDLEVTNSVLGLGHSLQTWYESKLTQPQRNFVDFSLTKSVRVRGPAGSGKTIAMVVKLLRQIDADRKLQRSNRYAFVTHSEATVELVSSMMRTMVAEDVLKQFTGDGQFLYLGTLYSFAFETLGAELRGVNPLSLDGREGRELQCEVLGSVFSAYLDSDWAARKGGCTNDFVTRLEATRNNEQLRNDLLFEILNEFACVLEPEGVSRSAQKREEYVSRSSREPWRLRLHSSDERRVILDLHTEFRKEMRAIEAISVDQMIADFDRFLDSNAWEITRATVGFDVIFVDELHLLNRMERMLIPLLQKRPEAKPIVVMAEDVKQDIRRTGSGLSKWQSEFGVGGLKDFDFDEVFRYTPQINLFLRVIDEFAPTLHLAEDWPNYSQRSELPAGPKPNVTLFQSLRDQYDSVFPAAGAAARKRKNGRTVAILTCDYANFKQYIIAGQHRDLFVPVESREDITAIPNRGMKCVLSTPEFVAGLQFEEVFLIDVSAIVLAAGEQAGVRDKRRGLAMVYLGSSRAMKVLHLSALTEAGGLPSFIEHAIENGTCVGVKV